MIIFNEKLLLGVGKSATIRALAQQTEKILRKVEDNPNHPYVILCAHTGKAANLIGNTLFKKSFIIHNHNLNKTTF